MWIIMEVGSIYSFHSFFILLLALLVGPERQVIAEKLHDEGGVLVAVLFQAFECNDGFIKGRFGGGEGQFPVA